MKEFIKTNSITNLLGFFFYEGYNYGIIKSITSKKIGFYLIMKLKDLKCENYDINLDEYIEFRENVKKNMIHPEWLGDFSKEDLLNLLNNNSKIWIYYLDKEPVCSMMLIPADKNALLKFKLGLDYKVVADYGPMFVNPKYVGNGLQYQMLLELDNYCINMGYEYAVTTIHPDNIYSINNIIKDDFKLINYKGFKRGARNIYLNCLGKNHIQKILTFIICDNKLLLLKGSNKDPQFHKSFWYVVTGAVEKEDKSLMDAVIREIKEETNLNALEIKRIPFLFKYESLGKKCLEHCFITYSNNDNIILNEESIDYKWCDLEEFIDLINWYDSKAKLKEILTKYFNNKLKK